MTLCLICYLIVNSITCLLLGHNFPYTVVSIPNCFPIYPCCTLPLTPQMCIFLCFQTFLTSSPKSKFKTCSKFSQGATVAEWQHSRLQPLRSRFPTSSGKAGSCLPLVGSLQYRTLTCYKNWFPLPYQLPVVI